MNARNDNSKWLIASIITCCLAPGFLAGVSRAQETGAGVSLSQLPQGWHDDHNHEFSFTSLVGHRVVLTMAFATCHRICPMTIDHLKAMQQAADARGEKIELVIVSYDPKNDSPAVWQQYRLNRHLDRDNWHFLNGSPVGTKRLAAQLGFAYWQYDDHVMHESRAVLFDSHGKEGAVLGSSTPAWANAL